MEYSNIQYALLPTACIREGNLSSLRWSPVGTHFSACGTHGAIAKLWAGVTALVRGLMERQGESPQEKGRPESGLSPATILLSLACRDKHVFVATKDVFCRDKSMLVATNIFLSRQNMFYFFFATKVCLSRKNMSFVETNTC